MPKSSRHQPRIFGEWFDQNVKFVVLALVAVAVLALVAIALTPRPLPQPTHRSPVSSQPTPAPTAEPRKQPAEAMALLADADRPFTINVLGDSTGALGGGWVDQTAEWLSETYNRPIELHAWDVAAGTYREPITRGSGTNAPIVIWNGSAPSRNVQYTLNNYSALVGNGPAIDLTFINHGHNEAPGALTRDAAILLKKDATTMTNAAIVVIGQNPSAKGAFNYDGQRPNVEQWMRYATSEGYAVVDVLTPFTAVGDYAPLLDKTGVHPTVAGAKIWADAVIALLSSP